MSTRSFDIYCGSYEIISSGLERLLKKHFFQKKGNLSSEEKELWPSLFRNIEYDKLQRTVCKGPQGFLTLTEFVIRWNLSDLGGCWIQKFFTKRQTFQWRKDFGLFFLILSNIRKVRKLFLRDHKVCLTIFLQLIKIYFWDLRGREQEFFHNVAFLLVTKVFG